ncbi:hypothetical protein ABK040_001143 [Willaertia magna]
MDNSLNDSLTPGRRSLYTPSSRPSTTTTGKQRGRINESISTPNARDSPIRGSSSYYKTPRRRSSSAGRGFEQIEEEVETKMNTTKNEDDFAKLLSPSGEKMYRKLSEEIDNPPEEEDEFKEFQKLLDKSKNALDKSDDEDSMKLLKQQLTQVQQIKYDNQRKQKIINDMQKQIEELLQFKEEAFHTRNEISVLKERFRTREEEFRRIENEAADRITIQKGAEKQLREELTQLQTSLTEEKTKRDNEVATLKKELEQLNQEVAVKEEKRLALEKELHLLSVSLKEQEELQNKKAKGQRELQERLQEQVEILNSARGELQERFNELETKAKKGQKQIEEKDLEIEKLKRKVDRLESERLEQDHSLNQLQSNIQTLQEKVSELNVEDNLVNDLKKELSVIPELRSELQASRKRLEEAQNSLERENHAKELVTEELRRLNEIHENLEVYLGDMKEENAQLKFRLEDMQKLRAENDFVNKELLHYKDSTEKLSEQLSTLIQQRDIREGDISSSNAAFSTELYSVQKMVETVLDGNNYTRIEDDSAINRKTLDTIKSNYKGMRTRVFDALDELIAVRQKSKQLQGEVDSLSKNYQDLEHEHSDTYKELINIKKQLSDSEKLVRALKEQRQELEDSVTELEHLLDNHQEEEKSRLRFVYALYRQLKDAPTDDRRNGSPLKGRANQEIEEPISWETFQSLFSEQVTTHLVERESLKKESIIQREKIVELTQKLEDTTRSLKELNEKYEKEKVELDKQKQAELTDLRTKLETEIEVMDKNYSEKVRELETVLQETKEQLVDISNKNKKTNMIIEVLKTELKDSQNEQGNLHSCLKLLARGVRPMKNRIEELKNHKNVLKVQLKHYERMLRGIYDTVRSLSAEFELTQEFEFPREFSREKSKTSFRAAVIAVIIGNRFIKLLKRRKAESESAPISYTVGGDKITLLAPSQISESKEFPYGTDDSKASVHSYLQLITHLDPQFETPRDDYSFVYTLQDGLFSNINRQIITGYKFSTQSPYSTPIKKNAKSIAHSSPQKRGLEAVQQTTLGVVKTLRELKAEKTTLQKKATQLTEEIERISKKSDEMEEIVKKKTDLISFMESRINDLEEENINLIEPEKYDTVRKEIEKLRANYAQVQYEKEQFKQEFESQLTQLNSYRADLQDVQDQLGEKTVKLENAMRELEIKREECARLFATSKKTSEMLSDLEKEKTKYESMVSELRQKLFTTKKTETTTTVASTEESDSEFKKEAEELEKKLTKYGGSSKLNTSDAKLTPLTSVKKKVEKDLSASQKIMKTLSESNARTNREVQELDKELKHARAHLAELQNSLSMGQSQFTSPRRNSPKRRSVVNVEDLLNRSSEYDFESDYSDNSFSSTKKRY